MSDVKARARRGWDVVRQKRKLAVAVVTVLIVGVGALAVGFSQGLLTPEAAPPSSAVTREAPPGFVGFVDPQTGLSLVYPADWQTRKASDPQVPLIVTRDDATFMVRTVALDAPVRRNNLGPARKLTDDIVHSNESVQMLGEPRQIEIAGLPAIFYFYSFKDPTTGLTGAHSHLFLFDQQKMMVLVFQTIPAERFPSFAPTFDQITSSIQVSSH